MKTHKAGFTLIEVIVAITFLSIGLLGLLATTAATVRVMGESDRAVTVAFQANEQLENLESLGCDNATSGSSTYEGIDLKWSVGGAVADRTRPVMLIASYSVSSVLSRVDTFEKVMQCVR